MMYEILFPSMFDITLDRSVPGGPKKTPLKFKMLELTSNLLMVRHKITHTSLFRQFST